MKFVCFTLIFVLISTASWALKGSNALDMLKKEPRNFDFTMLGMIGGKIAAQVNFRESMKVLPIEIKTDTRFQAAFFPHWVSNLNCATIMFKEGIRQMSEEFSGFLKYNSELNDQIMGSLFDTFLFEKISKPAFENEQKKCLENFVDFLNSQP